MTEEQQRIAIADYVSEITGKPWSSEQIGKDTFWNTNFPDYPNDLNAMHEAELTLQREDEHAYGCYISDLFEYYGNAVSLPARKRAAELLRTIGKWVEE